MIKHPKTSTFRIIVMIFLIIVGMDGILSLSPLSAQQIVVGSKRFTESYVLGEIARLALKNDGFQAEHRQGMGGTTIVWEALKSGAVTLYPDYTGTINEVILKNGGASNEEMRVALAEHGIGMSDELGFNNTYAIVMPRILVEKLGLRKISDLVKQPTMRVGIDPEFIERQDGWRAMCAHYGLEMQNVRAIEHGLSYAAIASGEIDLMNAYSTDAKLAEYNLVVLEDDLNFFPRYNAVFLYNLNIDSRALKTIEKLAGTIDEEEMIGLNSAAERTNDYTVAAGKYFENISGNKSGIQVESFWSKLKRWTLQHLLLVGVSLVIAILVGIPMGIRASRPGVISQLILGGTGMIQTIPSLALLALLVPVPFLGISANTAILALFLYSLLPIVRNTATGLQNIPTPLKESAIALGLKPRAQLTKIFLPIASRTILAGIKTSAVINVGTATLAALIGAGGLGEPIISGLNLNDSDIILQGAVPAAVLALVVQFLFELLDRIIIPKGLRLDGAARPSN